MPYVADRVLKEHGFQVCFTVGQGLGSLRPMLLLSPVLAETIAKAGWSKRDVQQYLFDNARMSARQFELYANEWTDQGHPTLAQSVEKGNAPKVFAESDDPERLVPIVFKPEDFLVVVTGDPLRTNAYVFSHNGLRGFSVASKSLPRTGTPSRGGHDEKLYVRPEDPERVGRDLLIAHGVPPDDASRRDAWSRPICAASRPMAWCAPAHLNCL